ncbi:D-alanyl-D-alanine carboxypeptidase/D-alanyl-D-alanine endopeptidase [Oceanobacillus halophilus]|uniref:D-alanyl-D-alanine carboxypeptidase/D-alanyl-D-alanine endopeptidase n=1 Tax=Oceanobacillus halophilus TaxID=930130 RepID=UPI001F4E776C|nr:D-alanyl-D-alanine carboxypeptidase/D-alanyl-D-alanine-endopeptidase [Oceanobacillus halophilus]
MKEKLKKYIEEHPKLNGALTGVSLRSPQTGNLLFEHQAEIRMHPASNMKLLTGAVALSVLGKDYKFSTEIRTDGRVESGTLSGNLYLIGKGNPTLLPLDLDDLAVKLKDIGIKTITGSIIGDDTWFDDERLSPDLVWYDEQYYYGAQVSALTISPNQDYDTGSVIIEVTPSKISGDKPIVSVYPETNYITIENNAITVNEDVEDELIVERKHATNQIIISGKISTNSESLNEFMAVWDVSQYVMQTFQQSLEKVGITCEGLVEMGKAPQNSNILLTTESLPLSEILVPFMKLSNNGHAEMLVKEMGKLVKNEGSWEKGLEVIKKELINYGINVDTLVLKDGSGISHSNAIPPNEITKLLYEVQTEDWFEVYLNSLPVAGKEDRMVGGTLSERLYELDVCAKTGTIEGVSTLSGFLTNRKGNQLIFSIMINHLLDEDEGKKIEDDIIEFIIRES